MMVLYTDGAAEATKAEIELALKEATAAEVFDGVGNNNTNS